MDSGFAIKCANLGCTFNPFVVGSTPAGPTKTLVNITFATKAATNKWLFFFVHTDYALPMHEVEGLNLSRLRLPQEQVVGQ